MMFGLKFIRSLEQDQEIAPLILERFGSFIGLYQKIFEIHANIYKITRQIPDDWHERNRRLEFHLWMLREIDPEKHDALHALLVDLEKTENRLEQCEIHGWELTDDIGRDFDEIKVRKKKKDFLQYMNREGNSHFPGLQDWIGNLRMN